MRQLEKETAQQITWLGEVLFDLSNISSAIQFVTDSAFLFSSPPKEWQGLPGMLEVLCSQLGKIVDDVSSIHHNLSEA